VKRNEELFSLKPRNWRKTKSLLKEPNMPLIRTNKLKQCLESEKLKNSKNITINKWRKRRVKVENVSYINKSGIDYFSTMQRDKK
jgi:hypothetical protein